MREGNEFNTDRVVCRPLEGGLLPAELAPASGRLNQTAKADRAGLLGRGVVIGVMTSLLLLVGMLVAPAPSHAQVAVGISVSFGPPALPIYSQPFCPGPGYVWTPGYWAWDPAYGYYWVPGTWVAAPFVGALWTPGYWAFRSGRYFWHAGYWGPVVGYYGGINYGYGYTGYGYHGGYWRHNRFYYNRAVNNIRVTNIRYYYNQRVQHVRITRVSYNGGPGGINARPTSAQLAAARRRRFGPVRQQEHQRRFARNEPRQRATFNRGRPDVAATRRPGEFKGNHAVRATRAGAPYRESRHTAPAGRRNAHPQPARNYNPGRSERFPASAAPRRSEPHAHVGRSAPARRESAPAMERRNAPRATRASQNRVRAPQARRPASHAARERAAHSASPGNHKGGNGNGNGNGNGHEHKEGRQRR